MSESWDPPAGRLALMLAMAVLTAGNGELRSSDSSSPQPGLAPSPPTTIQDLHSGHAPGAAQTRITKQTITLANRAVSLSWDRSQGGLRLLAAVDRLAGHTLPPRNELFEVILTDGTRWAASQWVVQGQPRVIRWKPQPQASRLAARFAGRIVELELQTPDGRLQAFWRAILHDQAHYLRQELDLSARTNGCAIREVRWFEGTLPDAKTIGRVDGVPVVAGNFFLGLEDPHALNTTGAEGTVGRVVCRLRREAPLGIGETLQTSFVLGVAPAGQMRRAFLYYVERERAHPYRPFLHYNSWYDIAWSPFHLNETNCLEAIRLFGERFIRPHGVVVDAMVFDDGWDDPKTLWKFHAGFPAGFAPLAEACRSYGTRLGVWLSPFGGYGEPKNQRLRFGGGQGYETNATGFSLAGPRYYAAFKQACVDMIRRYGVNHFKFDGIATGMYASGGAEYIRDTEAMRRLMLELRQEDPHLFINLTTGSWPSPFWLRFADSLWRQGGDMGLAGPGSKQEQWLTYRDQETFRNIVQKSPLYPLNALMTQGVAYSREGSAGEPTFNSAGFKHDVRAFFGAGTCLQELYIQPGRLTADDWQVLAEAAKWSRARADVLVDTHWIGGDPSKQEVYGYASWSPRRGVVMLRNPSDQPRDFLLDVGAALELPAPAPKTWTLRSPWAEDAAKPPLRAQVRQPVRLTLEPFQVCVFDASPEPGKAAASRGHRQAEALTAHPNQGE